MSRRQSVDRRESINRRKSIDRQSSIYNNNNTPQLTRTITPIDFPPHTPPSPPHRPGLFSPSGKPYKTVGEINTQLDIGGKKWLTQSIYQVGKQTGKTTNRTARKSARNQSSQLSQRTLSHSASVPTLTNSSRSRPTTANKQPINTTLSPNSSTLHNVVNRFQSVKKKMEGLEQKMVRYSVSCNRLNYYNAGN